MSGWDCSPLLAWGLSFSWVWYLRASGGCFVQWPRAALRARTGHKRHLQRGCPVRRLPHLAPGLHVVPSSTAFSRSNPILLWATPHAPSSCMPYKMGRITRLPSSNQEAFGRQSSTHSSPALARTVPSLLRPLHSSPPLLPCSLPSSAWEENDKNLS